MGLNEFDITITEAEKRIAELEREEAEAEEEIARIKKMTFGEWLKADKKKYKRVFETQKDAMQKQLKHLYSEELFNEFWDLLLNDKISCLLKFYEVKKIEIPEDKENAK